MARTATAATSRWCGRPEGAAGARTVSREPAASAQEIARCQGLGLRRAPGGFRAEGSDLMACVCRPGKKTEQTDEEIFVLSPLYPQKTETGNADLTKA